MSEVKRYTESCMEGGGVVESKDGELVDFSAWQSAQSELSALREELADARLCRSVSEGEWMEALTAAEQRNAELVDLLQECVNTVRFGEDFDLPVTTMARIDAALKPTESGASE